jgi:hypothetical protein
LALAAESGEARPSLPGALSDRQQDICEPLLAIADMAGGDWPERARAAIVALCCQTDDNESLGVKLLSDIRQAFDSAKSDKIATLELLKFLVELETDAPWASWWEADLKNCQHKRQPVLLPRCSCGLRIHSTTGASFRNFACFRLYRTRKLLYVSQTVMRRKITTETWQQIKTAYASGIGLREIARNMGIPEGTVLARAKRESWTHEIRSAKALAKPEDASLAVSPVKAVAISMQQRGERHVERMAGVSERAVDHIETMDGPEILNSVDQIEKLDKVARRTFGLRDDNALGGFSLNVLNIGTCEIEVGES